MTMHTTTRQRVGAYGGELLARYGFGDGHPFGPDRHNAFWDRLAASGLQARVRALPPVRAQDEDVLRFHTEAYLEQVRRQSATGQGYLDYGDTPAVVGIYESALYVVGSTLDAVARILAGELKRAMVPIAGLHHARRDAAAGFCVFNDCGIAIETLRRVHGIQRIAYVDMDAHHGDGVFYAFVEDPDLAIVDFHEDGHYLYPGTGHADETGTGPARGTKLNVPLPPFAEDGQFLRLWPKAERFLEDYAPEFILLQCGADALAGDPITHLQLSTDVYRAVTASLCRIADNLCEGRVLAVGGGGYDRDHTARAWTEVVATLVATIEQGAES